MQHQRQHDISILEGQIKELQTQFTRMSGTADLEELLVSIHRPGWTTVAEYSLVSGLVEGMKERNYLGAHAMEKGEPVKTATIAPKRSRPCLRMVER